MKTRSASTVRGSRVLQSIFSHELDKEIEVRVINETPNYTHVIVVESNSSSDLSDVHIIAEASLRHRFVSVVLYGDARKRAISLKAYLNDLLISCTSETSAINPC